MGRSTVRAVTALRKTLIKWRAEILNYHVERLSNGRVEGFNRVGKLIQTLIRNILTLDAVACRS
jgi:transposase